MSNEIIVVEQLPIIKEQLQQVKSEVQIKVDNALSLVCNEDTYKEVKAVRAKLNTEFKSWEDKRKQVKSAVLSPYEQFENVYKECITNTFNGAEKELKSRIAAVENELKATKEKEVVDYFNEYLASKNIDFIEFSAADIAITMSASLKSLKQKAKTFIDKVVDDLALIDTQEHKAEILVEYKKSLNVSQAITSVTERLKAIEEEQKKQAEKKAAEDKHIEVKKEPETLTAPTIAPTTAPAEELKLVFTVYGTKDKLKELKQFLIENDYRFE